MHLAKIAVGMWLQKLQAHSIIVAYEDKLLA
jgi:hypothetical protein